MEKEQFDVTQVAADVLVEFLEVAFHSILYIRDLYPAGIFQRKKKYNVPVQMSCHPDVNLYIVDILRTIKPLLLSKKIKKVALLILTEDKRPIERFMFEIASPSEKSALGEDSLLLRLEQSLRAFLLKLNTCDGLMVKPPKDCTWTVHVYTVDSAILDLQDKQLINDFTWVEADKDQTEISDTQIIPLKALQSPLMKMQMYVEESSNKS